MNKRSDEQAPVSERWVDGARGDDLESRAGALLRQASRPEPPEAARLAAIRALQRRGARRPQRHWTFRLAIALVLVLSGSALTAGAQLYFHLLGPARTAPPAVHAPAGAPAPRGRIRARAPRLALAPEDEAADPVDDPSRSAVETAGPTVEPPAAPAPRPSPVQLPAPVQPLAPVQPPAALQPPAPALPAVEASVHVARTAVSPRPRPADIAPSPPAPAPAPVEPPDVTPPPLPVAESASALAQESALLAVALRKLRQDGDARGALATLDQHDARFAAGALAPEATLARIEALIKMHKNRDALALLERATPSPLGRGRDLIVARAELRAAAGRCAAATRDFDLLLADDFSFDEVAERALWGRASCRATAKDTTGARRDLQDYLARFPSGRHAAAARAALGQ
jgi:hypothetical protein